MRPSKTHWILLVPDPAMEEMRVFTNGKGRGRFACTLSDMEDLVRDHPGSVAIPVHREIPSLYRLAGGTVMRVSCEYCERMNDGS